MCSMSAENKSGEEAVRHFAREVTLVVNPQASAANVASGILFHREDNKMFVLTAAHVFTDEAGNEIRWNPTTIGVAAINNSIADAVSAVHLGPTRDSGDRIDVAILALREEAQQALRAYGASTTMLATSDEVAADDYTVLTGSPVHLMRKALTRDPSREKLFVDVDIVNLYYVTEVQGRDAKGRLKVAWGEAQAGEDLPRADGGASHLNWKEGQRVSLGSPLGISGAGLWRVNKMKRDELWSARRSVELLGVAVAWNNVDTELVESVTIWRDWFIRTVGNL